MGKKQTDQGHGVRAEFLKDKTGKPTIEFFDPAYIRAENVIINKESGDVHAVLYDNLYYIGQLENGWAKGLNQGDKINLSAMHYNGYKVTLNAPISLN